MQVNKKLLIRLPICVLAVAGGVHLLHSRQTTDLLNEELSYARRLQEQGETAKAVKHFTNYVRMAPDDLETRVELMTLLDEEVGTLNARYRAFQQGEAILRLDPARDDVRRRTAEICLRLDGIHLGGLPEQALEHFQRLVDSSPDDPELLHRVALCYDLLKKFSDAEKAYLETLDAGFTKAEIGKNVIHRVDLYERLLGLYRVHLDQPEEADKLVEQMLFKLPKSYAARLLSARYKVANSQDGALRDLELAIKLAPTDPDAFLLRAQLVMDDVSSSREKLEQLRDHGQDVLAAHVEDGRLYQILSDVHLRFGDSAAALDLRRQGVVKVPKSVRLRLALADLLLMTAKDKSDLAEAKREIDAFRAENIEQSADALKYLDAKTAALEQDYLKAVEMLREVRQATESTDAALYWMASVELARRCRNMGSHDQQLQIYRELKRLDPDSIEAALGIASTLLDAGRIEQALEAAPPAALDRATTLQRVRLEFERTRRQPAADRNWRPLEQAIKAAQADERNDPAEVARLHALLLQAQGRFDQAREMLQQLGEKNDTLLVRLALAGLAISEEDWPQARSVLDDAGKQHGDSLLLRLARADYFRARDGEDVEQALVALEANADALPPNQRQRLHDALARIHYELGHDEAAQRLWLQLAEDAPHDLANQFRLFRIAISQRKDDQATERLAAIRRIEGDDGVHVLCGKALQMLARAAPDKTQLAEILRLLAQVEEQRPSWPLVHQLQATVHTIQHHYDLASEKYQESFDLGGRDPMQARLAVALLASRKQFDGAKRLLDQLKSVGDPALDDEVARLNVGVALSQRDFDGAVKQAREIVPSDSKDAAQLLWLADVLAAAGHRDEAAGTFESVTNLQPANPLGWLGWVRTLVNLGKQQEAESVYQTARKQLPPDTSPVVWGRCCVMLGKTPEATTAYQAAIATQSDDAAVLQETASFFMQLNRPDDAAPLFEKLIDAKHSFPEPFVIAARRSLAFIRAQNSDAQTFKDALSLVEQNIAAVDSTVDLRLTATLCIQRAQRLEQQKQPPGHLYRTAIQMLEKMKLKEQALPGDLLLLAKSYDAAGKSNDADRVWKELTTDYDDHPRALAEYGVRQIRKLRTVSPAEYRKKEVAAWIEGALRKHPNSIPLLMQLAEVRDLLQDVPRTIATYRQILTLDPNHAVTLNNLAWNVSTHEQKHAEALELIDRAIASANQNPDFRKLFGETLLDTKGSILIRSGRFTDAVVVLTLAVANESPVHRFHLAQALLKNGDQQAARVQLQNVHNSGLTAQQLQPSERREFEAMLSRFNLR